MSECKKACSFKDRCPLKKESLPDTPCHLGLQRARWIYTSIHVRNKDFDEAEGCQYGIADDSSNYCFFSFLINLRQPMSPEEISKKTGISTPQVLKILQQAEGKFSSLLKNNYGVDPEVIKVLIDGEKEDDESEYL